MYIHAVHILNTKIKITCNINGIEYLLSYLDPLQLRVEPEEPGICHLVYKVGVLQTVSCVCQSKTRTCRYNSDGLKNRVTET